MTYRVGDEAKPGDVYVKGPVELRCGSYQDVLGDVEPDAVICDPPYSERTHDGHDVQVRNARNEGLSVIRTKLCYSAWEEAQVNALVSWAPTGWLVAMSDHVMVPWYERAALAAGRYSFAPVPWVAIGSRVRIVGDGPSCWTTQINVSRPRSEPWSRWGTLPGAYVVPSDRGNHIGGKPVALMRALIRDYSRPGDLVCDPTAGGATTLIAAALEGRRAIGAELDPVTFAKACARIERTALTAPLPFCEASRMTQEGWDL